MAGVINWERAAFFLAFWAYAVLAFWDWLQSFLLLFAASVEIRYHENLYNDTMRWISIPPQKRK